MHLDVNKVEEQKDPVEQEHVQVEEVLPVRKLGSASIAHPPSVSRESFPVKKIGPPGQIPIQKDHVFSARRNCSYLSRKWLMPILGKPYVFDCSKEEDERGTKLCTEWAKAGFCQDHKATMFLFCRLTCLCIGPPEEPEGIDKFGRRKRATFWY